jgi:hypothetical protein
MSSVPRDLKKWYEDAVKEGKRASVKSGVSYVLFDRTGLSDEQIKLLSKEQGWRRVRYIGQSKAKNGKRPLQHFTDAINEVDADVFVSLGKILDE